MRISTNIAARYNGGRGSPDAGKGSSWYWRRQDETAYAGLAAGHCIFYADLNGDGRADEHYVTQSFNNIAYTSLSPPCGLHDVKGDDDDVDSNLPTPPETKKDHCVKGTGDGTLRFLCEYTCSFDRWYGIFLFLPFLLATASPHVPIITH